MTRFQTLVAAAAALFALPALAHDGVHIENPYARTMGGVGKSGAVFFEIANHADVDDRLVGVASDAAQKVELHTHKDDGNGVMQMVHVPEGFPIEALGSHALQRGGDHVMLMGLTKDFQDGDIITLTLTFEHAGEVVVEAPVDNARAAEGNGQMDHSNHMAMGQGAGEGMGSGMNHDHNAHAGQMGHGMAGMVDTTGMADPEAVTAVLKAHLEATGAAVTVEPVVVEGDYAIAGWMQGETGGRALMARHMDRWVIQLLAGTDLRRAEFLTKQGVAAAEALSSAYNAAEDALGAEKEALFSAFPSVVMIAPMH